MADPSDVGTSNLFNQLHLRQIASRLLRNSRAFQANLYRERFRLAKNLYKTDLRAHYGCVNAIEFSNGGEYLASGGDDKRVLIWNLDKALAGFERPRTLDTQHTSNIFCLGFDRHNRKVFSGGNDDLVIVHDLETGKLDNIFDHEYPVYGLSVDPQSDGIFATACEDGQILVYDQRIGPSDPLVVAQLRTSFHAVEFHPVGGNFLITANSKRGAAFWDIRKPHHPVIQYGYVEDPPSCMSVRFNTTGSQILALRRRLPPILYNTQSAEPVCTFYHADYYNSCTMKSCTFAGEDDEFVLSGSDDFNLYVWRVSDVDLECTDQWIETTQMVLYGHRSIVNQVRYNREKCLLASSGVEKIIKLWSPFNQKGWTGSLLEEVNSSDNPRDLFSPYNFPSMSPHSWSHMSHDYSNRNTNEDPRMMAFFDSLIQQEIEGWDTNNSTDSQLGSDINSSSSSNNSSVEDESNETRDQTHHLRRKKERRRRSSMLNKLKVQRNKFANRIAYLIATKRNTLRRLAMKGASLSNRRPHKIRAGKTNAVMRIGKRRSSCRTVSFRDQCSGEAGTSTSAGYRSHRRKNNKKTFYASSSDDDSETCNQIAGSSSRFDVSLSHNVSIPSTSTGITSSQKDDIIRLRQQQIFNDSDEDDEDESNERSHKPDEIVIDPSIQPTKKLNGVRRANDATVLASSNSSILCSVTTPSSSGAVVPFIQRTQYPSALSITNASLLQPIQITAESQTYLETHLNSDNADTSSNSSDNDRRRAHIEFEIYSRRFASNLNRYSRQGISQATPSDRRNSTSRSSNEISSLSKRRRLIPMAEYCSVPTSSNSEDEAITAGNNTSEAHNLPSTSSNSNSSNHFINNNTHHNLTEQMSTDNEHPTHGHVVNANSPNSNNNKSKNSNNNNYNNNSNHSADNNYNITQSFLESSSNANTDFDSQNATTSLHPRRLLQTPDSGISETTTTPSCSHTSTSHESSQSRIGHLSSSSSGNSNLILSSPCDENINKNKMAINLFYQKVAKVRRNYRKKFVDGSDSD